MPGESTLVCSFVTRGEKGVGGQGLEILLFTPGKQRAQRPDPRALTHILVETVDAGGSSLDASSKAIAGNLLLNASKDLQLVRRGKRLPWEANLYIEAFVWRTTAAYESGLAFAFEQQRGPPQVPPAPEKLAALEADLAYFYQVETRLGQEYHSWESFATFDDPSTMPEEFVSTAYYSAILPLVLDLGLAEIKATPVLSSSELADVALDILFEIIAHKIGRKAFKFWPPGVQIDPSTKQLPDSVLIYRTYTYLLDVVAFHLRASRPAHKTTISSVLLRALQPVQALMSTTITIEEFERKALHFISREVARSKLAQSTLEKLAISKLLEAPVEKFKKGMAKTKRPFLHIVTLGNSPHVFGVLRSLVHYLLTVTAHPYSTLHPGVNAMSKEQEAEYLARPDQLRLTIAETRPGCDGIALAKELHAIVEESSGRAKQLREMTRSYSDPGRINLAASTSELQMPLGLQERLRRGLAARVAGDDPTYGTLGELLRAADAKTGGSDATKVEVEVVPDLALAAVLRAAKPGIVVLLAAESILPGDADVVAKTGSFLLAFFGKEVKAKVFILAATETIESSSTRPEMPVGSGADFIEGWKVSTAGVGDAKGMEGFASKAVDKKVSTVKVFDPVTEIVPAKLIDLWITEAGCLNPAGIAQLSKERGVAEEQLYGKS